MVLKSVYSMFDTDLLRSIRPHPRSDNKQKPVELFCHIYIDCIKKYKVSTLEY